VPRCYLHINITLQNQKNNYAVQFSIAQLSREDCSVDAPEYEIIKLDKLGARGTAEDTFF